MFGEMNNSLQDVAKEKIECFPVNPVYGNVQRETCLVCLGPLLGPNRISKNIVCFLYDRPKQQFNLTWSMFVNNPSTFPQKEYPWRAKRLQGIFWESKGLSRSYNIQNLCFEQ